MSHHRRKTMALVKVSLLASCLFLITGLMTGCMTMSKKGPGAEGRAAGPMPVYYDFGDVLVPKELKVVKKESFLFRATDLSAGVLSLRGRWVDRDSLIAFFENSMPKDNWNLLGAVKTPNTMLLFEKGARWAMIEIWEGTIYTRVKIWVTTSEDVSGSGLLKQ